MAMGPFDVRNLIRPVAPGVPGAVNPLSMIGAGMASNNMLGALQGMGQLGMNAQQLALQQEEADRQRAAHAQAMARNAAIQRAITAPVEVPAEGPPTPAGEYPTRLEAPEIPRELEIAALIGPDAVGRYMQAKHEAQLKAASQEQWTTLTPQEAEAEGFKPGTVVQRSTQSGQLRTPGGAAVNITNIPAPTGGYEYFQTPEGDLEARKIPGGPAEKPTERQQDIAGYVQNAEAATRIMQSIEEQASQEGGEKWSPAEVAAAGNMVTRFWVSESSKRMYDAQLAWMLAVLRAESGAAITLEDARQVVDAFFPRANDSPTQIQEKAKLRATKERTMRERAGPALDTGGFEILED